jgi:transposase
LTLKLSTHDLRQLDEASIERLPESAARRLCVTLLGDLKEARERLEQTPNNSSRPPSSRAPWESGARPPDGDDAEAGGDEDATEAPSCEGAKAEALGADQDRAADNGSEAESKAQGAKKPKPSKRRPGKQRGARGFGCTQQLTAERTDTHRPCHCHICGASVPAAAPAMGVTKFQAINLERGGSDAPGLRLRVVDHLYEEVLCACGHSSRAEPHRESSALGGVVLSEWRLIGPGLAALIVALNQRHRLSRRHIREWLMDWLGLHFSAGLIHQTLRETAAAIAPLEETLIEEIQRGDLLKADETPWPEQGRTALWLWVFLTTSTTLFVIAGRGKATVTRILAHFTGHLMSDGWFSYRDYPHRLRCWAHLLRKAQGLIDSYNADSRVFGHWVLTTLERLIEAVYAACEGPPELAAPLATRYRNDLQTLREACRARLGHAHDKTRALAVEFFNDWDAIFRVLEHPHLPLTNNDAERALRHWVIARRISQGARTPQGSHVFTILASVIATCRQRGHSPWTYITEAITRRRAGLDLPPLPQVGAERLHAYPLELTRHVVLNPVRAGMVELPGEWPWSSYPEMIGERVAPEWLVTDGLLAQFSTDRLEAQGNGATLPTDGIDRDSSRPEPPNRRTAEPPNRRTAEPPILSGFPPEAIPFCPASGGRRRNAFRAGCDLK